jgi:hypothetical protein
MLVITALAALVILVPTERSGPDHGGAIRLSVQAASRSLLDRPTPPPPEGTPDPNVPKTLAELEAANERGERCDEGMRRVFVLFHGDALASLSHVDELVQRPGSVTWSLGTMHTRALPLDVLIASRPATEAVEIWPCRGEPLRVAAAEIRAHPGRWLLVRTPRAFLKVVDRQVHERRAMVRNVAAVRLLP